MMKNQVSCALLVDDDRAINFFNKIIVERHTDFQKIVSVESGFDAMDYLLRAMEGKEAKPSLILLDLNMPGMDGWEFIQKFEQLDELFTADIKLVILTTSSNPDDFHKSKAIPIIDDYINKPLSKDILSELVSKHYNIVNKI